MRQALFALVLVAASFAGGAVVNGPGLRWAQTTVLARLGLHSEDAEGDDLLASSPAPAPQAESESAEADGIPTRPIAPLALDRRPAEKDTSTAKGKESVPYAPEPAVGATSPEKGAAGVSASASASASSPRAEVREPESPGRDPSLPVASGAMVEDLPGHKGEGPATVSVALPTLPAAEPPAPSRIEPLATPRERAAEATTVDGSLARASLPLPLQEAPAPSKAPNEPNDWAAVRRALRDLGVSRYGTEGDPNGRVRFHCVIPLAGRRAVGQHFEAEGDDELQAARAALRRVALWRATESEPASDAP